MLKNTDNKEIQRSIDNVGVTSSSHRTEQAAFIYSNITAIIKNEMKKKREEQKIRKDLDQYMKTKEKKLDNESSHKLQKHRKQNRELQESRLQSYLKHYDQEQIRMKNVEEQKKLFLQEKKKENQMRLFAVRNNYIKINESLVQSLTGTVIQTKIQKYNPPSSASLINLNQIYYSKKQKKQQETGTEEEKKKITLFLQKQQKLHEIVLRRELNNLKRAEKSKNAKVTCFIDLRKQKQEARISKVEERYQKKVEMFQKNLLKIRQEKMQSSLSKCKQNLTKISAKENLPSKQSERNMSARSNELKWSVEKLQQQKKRLFHTRSFQRKKKEQNVNFRAKNFKVLYEKIHKLKNMGSKEVLSASERKIILEQLDKSSPQYAKIQAFLSTSKEVYVEKQIEIQQNIRKKKARKMC